MHAAKSKVHFYFISYYFWCGEKRKKGSSACLWEKLVKCKRSQSAPVHGIRPRTSCSNSLLNFFLFLPVFLSFVCVSFRVRVCTWCKQSKNEPLILYICHGAFCLENFFSIGMTSKYYTFPNFLQIFRTFFLRTLGTEEGRRCGYCMYVYAETDEELELRI